MKKFFNIIFVFTAILSCFSCGEKVFALSAGKLLVSPVNVPTVQSSYGVYPNTVDMISNEIVNSINKYSSFDVPDLNSAKDLIQSYGLSNDYKKFLMNYRDNRVVDYKICNQLGSKLGFDKILLVSSGYDVQNMFLSRSSGNKYAELFSTFLPFGRIFSKDLIFIGLPLISSRVYNNYNDESPITSCYKLNVQLALIDTETGLVVWEKDYNQDIPASDFGNPINSFGENVISSDKLKKFSEKIAGDASFEVYMAAKNSEYTSVKSSIVSSPQKTQTKALPMDGKMTRDGHPSSNNNYLENKRKQSYKNWVKEKAKN